MPDPQLLQQLLQALLPGGPIQIVTRLEDRHDVGFHGQLAEDGSFLGQVAQTELRAAVHGQKGDVAVVELDCPGVAAHQSDHHVERGRLAGAVGTEQAHDLAVGHFERQVADHLARLIALGQAGRFERAHGFFSGSFGRGGMVKWTRCPGCAAPWNFCSRML